MITERQIISRNKTQFIKSVTRNTHIHTHEVAHTDTQIHTYTYSIHTHTYTKLHTHTHTILVHTLINMQTANAIYQTTYYNH